MRALLIIIAAFVFASCSARAFQFDTLARAHNRTVLDTQLESLLATSIEWLNEKALSSDYFAISEYASQLQRVLRPSCKQCIDYFEAVAIVRSLGKAVKQILKDDRDDMFYPVLRRSYLAAMWMLQRSRLFVWQTSQLNSNVISTMFRFYLHHTQRAKGRAVSFHHVSKCGGTTMCQLASSNRCSNPSMDQERNCVLDSRLDGPIWMVAHDVTPTGAFPNATIGKLDAPAPGPIPWQNMTAEQKLMARNITVEPPLPMWLMYTCPYQPIGRPNTCLSRRQQAQETRSTFLANERTLSKWHGQPQVCPQFTNAIILREPIPHVVSLLAEVKFRYVRQLALWHNITSWQPPGWNLTWWETLGPALVGNYATRTLIGRESFCRSAANITERELSRAVNALLSFDLVMTLDRSRDIDLLVSTLLGWPAMQFSSQPASRVRQVTDRQDDRLADSMLVGGTGQPGVNTIASSQDSATSSTHTQTVQIHWPTMNAFTTAAAPGSEFSAEDAKVAAAFGLRGRGDTLSDSPVGVFRRSRMLLSRLAGSGALKSDPNVVAALVDAANDSTLGQQTLERFWEGSMQPQQLPPLSAPAPPQRKQFTPFQLTQGPAKASEQTAHQGSYSSDVVEHSWGDGDYGSDGDEGFDADDDSSDEAFEKAAAALYARSVEPVELRPAPPPPPAVPLPVLEAAAAVNLVRSHWLERQVKLMGYTGVKGAHNMPPSPVVTHLQQHDEHGAHLVKVASPPELQPTAQSPQEEVWHAFPRHNFAFTASDMARLEQLTALDAQLVQTADLLLDLDTVWLQSLMNSHHYRKRMKSVATTYTACGFAGMLPLTETVQDHVFQPVELQPTPSKARGKLSKPWISL